LWTRAISFRLSAKDIEYKVLADCLALTAESSIQNQLICGWTRVGFHPQMEPAGWLSGAAPAFLALRFCLNN
jgi:hypothetical protein